MSHNTLGNYYEILYNMVHQNSFATIAEFEHMIPFELDVYISMITKEQQQQIDQMKMQESLQRNSMRM